jgi:hypothetical protein
MSTRKLSRHDIVRIAVVTTGALALCSGGAYALASTSAGTTVSSPPHTVARAHLSGGRLMCPMIRAGRHANVLCTRIGPIRACAPNAMCLRPCVLPVVVMTPPHPGDPVPPKMTMRGRCVILRGVNPGGSGSAAGSPPAVIP